MDTIVYIDAFGRVVDESESKYKVTLSGGYTWSEPFKAYWHDVKEIKPKLPMSRLLSDTILVPA